jgi:lipopolysaccharide transport system permease protein
MVHRDIAGRYRGTLIGMLWSLLTPLFMLAVYTIVFGAVFKSRWTGQAADTPPGEFAIILFAGLTVFQLFGEVINRSPSLVLTNVNLVKKVVFPLEILAPVALGSAVCHAAISLIVLLGAMLAVYGAVPLTALWSPVILAPYALLILGLAWLLASLGVYYRDTSQVLGTLVTALMFLSPVFYPLSALPESLRPWLALNPIVFPVEATRAALVFGKSPDLGALLIYSLIAAATAASGYMWFQRTRRGFADVL